MRPGLLVIHAGRMRWFVASAVLVALALPHLPRQLDDYFISWSYAIEWARTGSLQWDTGERVEGFSNFLWLLWMRLGVAAGMAPALWGKGLSLVAGVATLGVVHALAPRTLAGTVVLFAVALWPPLAYWSALGLETTLAGLLALGGWALVVQGGSRWSWGVVALAGLALCRPEGSAHLLLALLARAREMRLDTEGYVVPEWRRSDLVAGSAVAVIVGWHVARVAWFGDFWPTPYLVKVVAGWQKDHGFEQLGRDAAILSGVGIAAVLATRTPRLRDLPIVAAPVALHAALLLNAQGDWMGMSRLVLPGVLGGLGAWLAAGRERRVRVPVALVGAVPALVCACWLPDWPGAGGFVPVDVRATLRPSIRRALTFETPFTGDIEWMVWRLPEGARIQVGDVGMLSLLPDVATWDSNGLVDRPMAEALAAGLNPDDLPGRYEGPDAVQCVRTTANGSEPPRLPARIADARTEFADLRYGTQWSLWWCLPGERPSLDVVRARWAALFAAVPDQPWIRWQYARSLGGAGDWEGARSTVAAAMPNEHWALAEVPGSLQFVDGPVPTSFWPGRGFGLYFSDAWTSRVLTRREGERADVLLDVDEPGPEGAQVDIRWKPDCDAAPLVVTVSEATRVRAPAPACDGDVRLVVRFLNDSPPGGPDRNLYVGMEVAE